MELLDEEGNLFELVNAVDTLVVVFVVVILVTATVLVAVPGGSATDGILVQQVVVEVHEPPAGTVETGLVNTRGIVAVENASIRSSKGDDTLRLVVRLRVEQTEGGLTIFNGSRLYIGRKLTLDLGKATVSGVVVEAFEPFRMDSTPTPSPTPTPSRTPSPTPTRSPTPSPTPTASPTASPTPTPTPSPTPTTTPIAEATPGPTGATTHLVTFVATVPEERVDRIETGSVEIPDIVVVTRKVARPIADGYRLELTIELSVQRAADGTVFFRGVELAEGQLIILDFGTVEITGRVTDL